MNHYGNLQILLIVQVLTACAFLIVTVIVDIDFDSVDNSKAGVSIDGSEAGDLSIDGSEAGDLSIDDSEAGDLSIDDSEAGDLSIDDSEARDQMYAPTGDSNSPPNSNSMRHCLSQEAISDLLSLIQILLPYPNSIPTSFWCFPKYIKESCIVTHKSHFYCTTCYDNVADTSISICPTCQRNCSRLQYYPLQIKFRHYLKVCLIL